MFRILGCSYFAIFTLLIVVFCVLTFKRKSILSKNNFVGFGIVSVLLYTLYLTAAAYSGTNITFFTLVTYIKKVIDTACFAPDISLIEAIGKDIGIFRIDFALAVCLLTFTTISSTITLFSSTVANRIAYSRLLKKPCDVVVGYSPNSLKYAEKNENCILLCPGIAKNAFTEAKAKGIPVINKQFSSAFSSDKFKKAEHHFLAFADSDTDFLALAKQVAELAKASSAHQYMHIEASEEQVGAIRQTVHKDGDRLSVIPLDKAGIVAKDFVFRYPISKALFDKGFLLDNGSLKSEKRVNIVFVGFGKVSRRLFTTFAEQYQFAAIKNGKAVSAPVHYYFLDSDKSRTVAPEISRIRYEFDIIAPDGDFGSADPICIVEKAGETIDVYAEEAMKLYETIVDSDSYTEFVISLTQSYSDFAYADHIADYLGNRDYRIFVRNPSGIPHLTTHVSRIFSFGESEELFTHRLIVDDSIRLLSQATNSLYLASSGKTNMDARSWEDLPVIERKSNVSAALNIPFKLGLLGLSLKKGKGMTNDEYLTHYKKNPTIGYHRYIGLSSDNILAFCEHARWNAFYLLEGYRPLHKNELVITKDENGKVLSVRHKNISEKKHACITSYYDLEKLINYKFRLFTGRDATADDESGELFTELAGIYSYDYMIMDSLYDNLTYIGYGIE